MSFDFSIIQANVDEKDLVVILTYWSNSTEECAKEQFFPLGHDPWLVRSLHILVLYLELWWRFAPTNEADSWADPDLSPPYWELMPFGTILLLLPPPRLLLLCCPINVISPATTCSDAWRELCSKGQADAEVFSAKSKFHLKTFEWHKEYKWKIYLKVF